MSPPPPLKQMHSKRKENKVSEMVYIYRDADFFGLGGQEFKLLISQILIIRQRLSSSLFNNYIQLIGTNVVCF
jgi:hypothetical protein